MARDVLPIQINLILGSPCNCFVWDVWDIWLKFYRLPVFFYTPSISAKISVQIVFVFTKSWNHWANCWRIPLVVSGSWQFLHNFPVLVMQFNVSCALCEHFFMQFIHVQTLLTVTLCLLHVHAECQREDSLTVLQRKLKQSQVLRRSCDISF